MGFGAVVPALALCLAAGTAGASGLVGARAALQDNQAGRGGQVVPGQSGAEVTAVRLDNQPDAAELVFELSQPVAVASFVLTNPDRVIIDLPQVAFAIKPETGAPERHHRDRKGAGKHAGKGQAAGLVASYRFGLLAPGRSRIVVDLGGPARIAGATVRAEAGRSVLAVSLRRTDRAAFEASAHDATPTASLAPRAPAPVPGRATVVIDPGHGGPDTGAIVNGVVEKDVTLAFAKMLAGRLEAGGHFNVVMTRAGDVFIPLSERVRVARASGAALLISVHADTLPETADVGGATVYTVSDKASDAYAATVAAKENAADAAGGVAGQAGAVDVNDILFDLTRQETRAYAHVFARTLVNYWKTAGRLNKNPRRAAGFVVLKAPDVPSVLLELGYLSNAGDAASLTSDEWRAQASGRMAEAVEAYFADQRGPAKAAAGVSLPLGDAPLPRVSAAGAAN